MSLLYAKILYLLDIELIDASELLAIFRLKVSIGHICFDF